MIVIFFAVVGVIVGSIVFASMKVASNSGKGSSVKTFFKSLLTAFLVLSVIATIAVFGLIKATIPNFNVSDLF